MSKRPLKWIAALYGLALLACSAGDAKADRRVALVVGNSHYSNPSLFLANPKNDAEDVAAALRGVGFEVLQAVDANKRELDLNMAKFARLAIDADAALFYYAGHAVQYQGRNYLMPTDAEVEDEISFRYQMTPLDDVRAALDRGDGVKIVILDACRNNPIVNALRRKKSNDSRSVDSVRGGLAKIDRAQGMVVAYSTAADEVAADGDGRNSPFTSAFLKRLKEPGLEIEQLFRRVAADVNSSTGGRQRPETYVSLLSNYYLNQTDRIAFDKIKDSPDPGELQGFIAKYPTSSYVAEAQTRINRIEAAIRERQLQLAKQQEAVRLADEQRRAASEAAMRSQAAQEEVLRKQDDQRAKFAAERLRKEREAAQQQEEQRLKLVAERERKEREAAQQLEEQRVRLAADRLRREREAAAAQRLQDELQRSKLASIESKLPEIKTPDGKILETRTAPAVQTPPLTVEQACERDSATLARLRSNPSLDQVVQFAGSLSCEKLRPQVSRLQESLSAPGTAPVEASRVAPEPTKPAVVAERVVPTPPPAAPKPEVIAKPPERVADAKDQPKPPVAAADQEQACKQEETRLARIRSNSSLSELATLERDLACPRLRPQIVRLRESLTRADQAALPPAADPNPQAAPAERPADAKPAEVKPAQSGPVVQVRNCDQERATLAQLRASPSREDVIRFERELACEQLRPQVMRLRESLSGG